MNFSEMQTYLGFLVDDAVDASIATILLNQGQNKMAVAVKCNFPQIDQRADATFVFPEKFHELPVLYAAAMYKTYDASTRESESIMTRFLMGMLDFTKEYTPPKRYLDDINVAQFIAESEQYKYTITKEGYDPHYSRLKAYLNDIEVKVVRTYSDKSFEIDSRIIINPGDAVTAIWEVNSDFTGPPYEWWVQLR